jgi:hypothetical protein
MMAPSRVGHGPSSTSRSWTSPADEAATSLAIRPSASLARICGLSARVTPQSIGETQIPTDTDQRSSSGGAHPSEYL